MGKKSLAKSFEKIGLPEAKRHAFLCTGPNCCAKEDGQATWKALKGTIKDLDAPALRTKADCLRVCQRGPLLVVYPEGTWYADVTPERCERIVREHLLEGRPIAEWTIARHPLAGGRATPPTPAEPAATSRKPRGRQK